MTLHTFGWMNKLLGATLLAALSSGCAGGSGSSGFDAKFAESAAIMRALAERRCVTPETQKPVYCPADVAVPAGGPGTINVGLDQTNLPCSASGGTQCTVGLPFMPEGLPTSASYRTAIRTVDPIGAWHIDAAPPASNAPGTPDYDGTASIDLPAASATPGPETIFKAQIAILVYLTPPTTLPLQVETLAASGADFAYVSEDLSLQITF